MKTPLLIFIVLMIVIGIPAWMLNRNHKKEVAYAAYLKTYHSIAGADLTVRVDQTFPLPRSDTKGIFAGVRSDDLGNRYMVICTRHENSGPENELPTRIFDLTKNPRGQLYGSIDLMEEWLVDRPCILHVCAASEKEMRCKVEIPAENQSPALTRTE